MNEAYCAQEQSTGPLKAFQFDVVHQIDEFLICRVLKSLD